MCYLYSVKKLLLRRVRHQKHEKLEPIPQKHWEAFLSSLKPVTAKNYASSMRALTAHLQEGGIRMGAARLLHAKKPERVLERWQVAMQGGGAAKATVQARLSGARAFLRFEAKP